MRILREFHGFRDFEKTGPLLELFQNRAAQIADELPLLINMYTCTASQRLIRRKLIVGADSNIKLQIQNLRQCPLPLPDIEVRNHGKHDPVRVHQIGDERGSTLGNDEQGHAEAVVQAHVVHLDIEIAHFDVAPFTRPNSIRRRRIAINFPENYVIYRLFWEEAQRQGALSGYAHYGATSLNLQPAFGLAIDLPHGLVSFLEVLQFNRGAYQAWYEILNTGFRITPTAGTDYPCAGASIPGRERFYTKVEGPFTYENWLEGVRRGRTFVTNGPILEFQVDDKGMGEEVVLEQAGPVKVRGRVHFDPSWDDIERLEVIENGLVLRSFPRTGNSSEIRFQFEHPVGEASWLAIRAYGKKLGEAMPLKTGLIHRTFRPTSEAHSAPIYLSLHGAPSLSAHPRAKVLARTWLARLEDLESRLAVDEEGNLALERPLSPRRTVETGLLRRNRSALLEEIQKARDYFTRLAQ